VGQPKCLARTFNGVIEWEDVDAFAVFDVVTWLDSANVTQLDAKVVSGNWRTVTVSSKSSQRLLNGSTFVHLDLALWDIIGCKADED
jgi:hypothetical protein